jgi:adenine phosphoribosyltransferase
MKDIQGLIREVKDFPKPGINFYDITTLLKDPTGLQRTLGALKVAIGGLRVDKVIGIESRGFFFAPVLAYSLGVGFVPVRKPKKLPADTVSVEYALEYGTDRLEMHRDAVAPGEHVLIVDDVLATGGTASAVAQLVEKVDGQVSALVFVIELDFLDGRSKLGGRPIVSLLHY